MLHVSALEILWEKLTKEIMIVVSVWPQILYLCNILEIYIVWYNSNNKNILLTNWEGAYEKVLKKPIITNRKLNL